MLNFLPLSERSRHIFVLSLPIIGGMMSQNLLNLVDAAMVGVLGASELAAVGLASFINFVAAALFLGLSAGVQAMVARRMGEGRQNEAANPLNGALLLIALAALPVTLVLALFAEPILSWLNDDASVVAAGTPYLQARLAGIMAIGMNFCFRGYWSAIKRTGFYLRTLIFMHSLNILLSYLLIFGKLGLPELGTLGAGLGTSISLFCGTAYYAYLAHKHTQPFGFGLHLPTRTTLWQVFKISLPSSLQQLMFALGFTLLFWIVGQVGTEQLAAAHVITTLTLVLLLPCIAFGLSAATLVGQALGRGEQEDAHQWGWHTAKVAAAVAFVLGMPMWVFPDVILSGFLHEPAVIDIARMPLQLVGLGMTLDAVGIVLMHALNGAGATHATMVVSFVGQWLLFLPLAYVIGPVLGYGLLAIWLAQILYRSIQTGVFAALWQRRRWQTIKV